MQIKNPTPVSELLDFCTQNPITEKNQFITEICKELSKINTQMTEDLVSTVFVIAKQHSKDISYIDVGCAILALMTQPKEQIGNIIIDISNGKIGVTEDKNVPDNQTVAKICDSIKMVILETSKKIKT
jgi:hypothetical protein